MSNSVPLSRSNSPKYAVSNRVNPRKEIADPPGGSMEIVEVLIAYTSEVRDGVVPGGETNNQWNLHLCLKSSALT